MKKKSKGLSALLILLCLTAVIFGSALTVNAAGYRLNRTSLSLNKGSSYVLTVNTKSKITWKSSASSVVSVASNGKVTARKTGTAYVTAKSAGRTLKCKVTVFYAKMDASSKSVEEGKSFSLKVSGKTVSKWSSSDTGIASVTSSGKVTSKKPGKCTIYAYVGNSRLSCTVTVTKKKATVSSGSAQLIAHRGAYYQAPENTIPSFQLAARQGYKAIECDVRETKDGALVISHDASLLRSCGIDALISNLTLKQIRQYRIISGNGIGKYPNLKIPTLEEYLKVCNQYKCTPVIEIKSPMSEKGIKKLYNTISGSVKSPVVISFSTKILVSLRKYNSRLSLQKISKTWSQSLLDTCKKYKFDVSLQDTAFTAQNVKSVHNAKLKIGVWVAENQSQILKYKKMGADYITVNI